MAPQETIAHTIRAGLATDHEDQVAHERISDVARSCEKTRADLLISFGWNREGEVPPDVIATALDATADVDVVASAIVVPATPTTEPVKPLPLRAKRVVIGSMITTPAPQIDMVLRGLPLGSYGVISGSGGIVVCVINKCICFEKTDGVPRPAPPMGSMLIGFGSATCEHYKNLGVVRPFATVKEVA